MINNYNWAIPDYTTYKIDELEKDVEKLEEEISQQGLGFKREEGTESFYISKDTIHVVNTSTINFYPLPDLSLVKNDENVLAYTLPRNYINDNNEVIGTVYSKKSDNNFLNPSITKNQNTYTLTYTTNANPQLNISDRNPFDMYVLGELKIEWIPKPTTLSSPAKVVCDIIEAKNALSLYETPIPVFFRPINYGETDTYWWMTWGYNSDSEEFNKLLEGQPFIFTETSFGHNYTLYKNGNTWTGNNFCTAFPNKTSYNSRSKLAAYEIFIKNDDNMKTQLQAMGINPGSNTAMAITPYAKIYKSNGELATTSGSWYSSGSSISGYDKAAIVVEDKSVKQNEVLTCKIDINNNITSLTASSSTSLSGLVWLTPIINCVDSFIYYKTSTIEPQNELKLYMKKGEVFKFTDNNWDGKLNPFVYLNNIDGYNITPDPSSAATLTTPYSIVSNGVMLAENLQSHTFKINDLGNDVSVINNQITNLNNQVFSLQRFQSDIEEKNKWYNVIDDQIISVFGQYLFGFVPAIPILNNLSNGITTRETTEEPIWKMSYEGIISIPKISFSNNSTVNISAISTSTNEIINDETVPTTQWVINKLNSASASAATYSTREYNFDTVIFHSSIINGTWKDINLFIHDNFKSNQIVIFQTNKDLLHPLLILFICHTETATAFATHTSGQIGLYVSNIIITQGNIKSISWSKININEIDDSTTKF